MLTTSLSRGACVALFVYAGALAGCGDDDAPPVTADAGVDAGDDAGTDAGPPRDWPLMEVPESTITEPGVRREIFRVAGATPPPNPTTMEATPAELNFTQVVRYRSDVEPAADPAAIVVAMPGTWGGAASWEPLARALVKRGVAAGRPTEVWAIDRRANLLEDLRGADAAEAAGNPDIAQGYYFLRETVGGQAFPGFRRQGDVGFMSEWGLAVHVEDVHRVIATIPAAERKTRVFLAGHSAGASFAETYAGWRFEDGSRGADELAGLVLVDGAAFGGAAITEDQYVNGVPGGVIPQPGVDNIRSTSRFAEIPFLGVAIYARFEVLALRVLAAPTEVVADDGRDGVLRFLFSSGARRVPPLTNRAALGFGFDASSNPLVIARMSIGAPTGGPLESYMNPFGTDTIVRPADSTSTYDWVDGPDTMPAERVRMADFAHATSDGRTNFAEWYYPTRLPMDQAAIVGNAVAEDGYQARAGLRAFDGPLDDAPVLAIAAALVSPAAYDAVRARVAPMIGPGRPAAGALRSDPRAFSVVDVTTMTHIDPVQAADVAENPVPAAIDAFVAANAAP